MDVICLTNVYHVRLFMYIMYVYGSIECQVDAEVTMWRSFMCRWRDVFHCFTFGFSYTSMVILNSVLCVYTIRSVMLMHSENV